MKAQHQHNLPSTMLRLGLGETPVRVTWSDTLYPHEAPIGQTLEVFEIDTGTTLVQISEWATGKTLERTDSHVRTCCMDEVARLHSAISPERHWDFPALDDIIDACEGLVRLPGYCQATGVFPSVS